MGSQLSDLDPCMVVDMTKFGHDSVHRVICQVQIDRAFSVFSVQRVQCSVFSVQCSVFSVFSIHFEIVNFFHCLARPTMSVFVELEAGREASSQT